MTNLHSNTKESSPVSPPAPPPPRVLCSLTSLSLPKKHIPPTRACSHPSPPPPPPSNGCVLSNPLYCVPPPHNPLPCLPSSTPSPPAALSISEQTPLLCVTPPPPHNSSSSTHRCPFLFRYLPPLPFFSLFLSFFAASLNDSFFKKIQQNIFPLPPPPTSFHPPPPPHTASSQRNNREGVRVLLPLTTKKKNKGVRGKEQGTKRGR